MEAVVVGGGAREHALVWGLVNSGAKVYACPGNAGIAESATLLRADTADALADHFDGRRPLIVIGPEQPLAEGWADRLRERGFLVVGPSAQGARLESSKRFAKEIMRRYRIPTAASQTAFSAATLAQWVRGEQHWPKVLKLSRLAQGKGVEVVRDETQALAVVARWAEQDDAWVDGVLYEDYLEGQEISVQVVTNGRDFRWLPIAQDNKRLTSDPKSPNTGGMGAVAPIRGLTDAMRQQIEREIIHPVLMHLQDERIRYDGIIYFGLMLTRDGPYVLEFNVRLGDPEAEVVVPILSLDWVSFWSQVACGELPEVPQPRQSAVAVVMAAPGYPQSARLGISLGLGEDRAGTQVFHGATHKEGSHWFSRGGRVLTVVGQGENLAEARHRAYERIRGIDFPHAQIRPDIGTRDLLSL